MTREVRSKDTYAGAAVAAIAVFLPGTLLVFAGLPLWSYIRNHEVARPALAGLGKPGYMAGARVDSGARKCPGRVAAFLIRTAGVAKPGQ